MSKYQEALDRLCENDYFDEKGNCNCDLIVMDRILLQELVDKATPKKIDMMRYKKYDGYNIGVCKCGKTIDDEDDEINYCPKCGQAIDWSEK